MDKTQTHELNSRPDRSSRSVRFFFNLQRPKRPTTEIAVLNLSKPIYIEVGMWIHTMRHSLVGCKAACTPLPRCPGDALRGYGHMRNVFNYRSTPYVHLWSPNPLIIGRFTTSSDSIWKPIHLFDLACEEYTHSHPMFALWARFTHPLPNDIYIDFRHRWQLFGDMVNTVVFYQLFFWKPICSTFWWSKWR